jgi:predicted SprT family Zn-dependent metalloprotease
MNSALGEYCSASQEIRISKKLIESSDYDHFKQVIFHEVAHLILDRRGKFKRLHRGAYYRSKNRAASARKAIMDEIRVEKYARFLQRKVTGTQTTIVGYSGVDNNEIRDEHTINHYVHVTIKDWQAVDLINYGRIIE